MTTLIFDCDGVLADTERDGHRIAFNQMFAELGIPIEWSVQTYAEKLRIGGGKERMAAELTPELLAMLGIPDEPEAKAAEVARWHARKTEIYKGLVATGALPPRPGIRRVITEAQDAGWTLGIASTSAEPSVRAILEQAVGKERADRFDVFLAGDVVPAKKPAPDIYLLALDRLRVDPSDVLVVEDSRNGLLAAVGAGLRCLVTLSSYTADEDMSEAVLVVSSLGDPGGESTTVIANRSNASPGAYVSLDDLHACLD